MRLLTDGSKAYASNSGSYSNAPYSHAPIIAKAASYYVNSGDAVHIRGLQLSKLDGIQNEIFRYL
jgi:hypothetical protein